jgi:alpha-glucosidase (family GH31 glycosyl hydrolase)
MLLQHSLVCKQEAYNRGLYVWVIRQYHQVIGASAMPPYWALGLHQSKW